MWWIVGRITVGSFDNNKITFRNRHLQLGGDFFMSKIVNKEMMSKCKVNDCYHRAFFYVMGIAGETRANINQMFDFKQDCIEPERVKQSRAAMRRKTLPQNMPLIRCPTPLSV